MRETTMITWFYGDENFVPINLHILAELEDRTMVSGHFRITDDDEYYFEPDIHGTTADQLDGEVDPAVIVRYTFYPPKPEAN